MKTSTMQNPEPSAVNIVTKIHQFVNFVRRLISDRKNDKNDNFTKNMVAHMIDWCENKYLLLLTISSRNSGVTTTDKGSLAKAFSIYSISSN